MKIRSKKTEQKERWEMRAKQRVAAAAAIEINLKQSWLEFYFRGEVKVEEEEEKYYYAMTKRRERFHDLDFAATTSAAATADATCYRGPYY